MKISFEKILQSFPAASEYLSSIYLINRDYKNVSNSRLASWLNVSRPAITQAASRLKKLELITQERYGDIKMTSYGEDFAKKMLRRHYLLEHFLMKNLGFDWHQIDEEAKRLQNSISDIFESKIFEALGKPHSCPHGNPIPGTPGEAEILSAPPLDTAEQGSRVRFMRITEQGEEEPGLLQFIYDNSIELNDEFVILGRNGNGTEVKIFEPGGNIRHNSVVISPTFSQFLCYLS